MRLKCYYYDCVFGVILLCKAADVVWLLLFIQWCSSVIIVHLFCSVVVLCVNVPRGVKCSLR